MNKKADSSNCGLCGTVCTAMHSCDAGLCACPAALPVDCFGSCVNTGTDPTNCGACATRCPSSANCVNSLCACPGGAPVCGGFCCQGGTQCCASNCQLSHPNGLVSLAMIVGGAKIFVTNMEDVATTLGTPPLVLALILAPLATELPEKFNSVIWVRNGKDTLALGNISGAMVFQSCIPVSVGMVFTDWDLEQAALVSAIVALLSTAIVFLSMRRRGLLSAGVLARSGLLYVGFVVWVVLTKT